VAGTRLTISLLVSRSTPHRFRATAPIPKPAPVLSHYGPVNGPSPNEKPGSGSFHVGAAGRRDVSSRETRGSGT
jgi:hypothetical protein